MFTCELSANPFNLAPFYIYPYCIRLQPTCHWSSRLRLCRYKIQYDDYSDYFQIKPLNYLLFTVKFTKTPTMHIDVLYMNKRPRLY